MRAKSRNANPLSGKRIFGYLILMLGLSIVMGLLGLILSLIIILISETKRHTAMKESVI